MTHDLVTEYKGHFTLHDVRIGIVASRFNEFITKSLFNGALEELARFRIPNKNIIAAWVPGSYEIPLAAKQMALTTGVDAIICLGAIIKGETAHFEYIAGQVTSGISQISLETHIPVVFGVLTTSTLEQAMERAGSKAGNKGSEAVQTALEMVDLLRQLKHVPQQGDKVDTQSFAKSRLAK